MGKVGFNVAEVIATMHSFYSKGEEIYYGASRVIENFYSILKENWFSPKAAEFSKYLYDMDRCAYNVWMAYQDITYSIQVAYNSYAAQNDLGSINKYEPAKYQREGWEFGDRTLLEQSPDGDVIMDVDAVQIALDTFKSSMQNIVDSIVMPSSLSLYDNEGKQVYMFETMFVNNKNKLKASIEEAIIKMEGYITEYSAGLKSTVNKVADSFTMKE